MAIYFTTFISSYFFCMLGEHMYAYNKKRESTCFKLLAVLIPAIIAGIRDYTVGTDVATYGHWLFLGAVNTNSLKFFILSNKSIDILYSVFVYFISCLFKSEHWLYFFSGLLTYLFVMLGLCRYRKYINVPFAWLSYLFLFYGDSLNTMRQCIAVSLTFFGCQFFMKRKWKSGIAIILVACLFHNTAIIAFGIVVIYYIIEKIDSLICKIWILLITSVILISYSKLISLGVGIGLLNDKFLKYGITEQAVFSLNPIFIRIPYILLIWMFYQSFSKKNSKGKTFSGFIVLMMLMEMISAEMRVIHPTLYRISLYFGMYRCLGIGRVVRNLKGNNKKIVETILLVLLIITWIYQNVAQGNNEIYPFTSELIGV